MKRTLLLLAVTLSLAVQSQTYISEIMVDPPGDDYPNEFIEFRGVPNSTLVDTYLVVVEGDGNDPGDLNSVHDLSGLTIGANGFLVLANDGHPYNIDAQATVVTGLLSPGGGNLESQTHTFMLVESAVAPTTSDDIDSDDNGVADGTPYTSWTILDSGITLAKDNDSSGAIYAYSEVIFLEDDAGVDPSPTVFSSPTAVVIETGGTQFDYAGRIGNSTGSLLTSDVATSDWAGGNINSNPPTENGGVVWQIGSSSSAIRAYPEAIEGDGLDNVGSANFPNVWTGATDNDWGTAGNWENDAVPELYEIAVIPEGVTNYPTITSAVTLNAIDVASGASLIANAAVTGDVTYNRALTANWHLVSSPVAGETIEDIIANHTLATGTGTNIGIAPYVGGAWDYQADDSMGSLDGQGYSILLAAAGDVSFTGTVNTADVDQAVVAGDYNLVGNPYTSYVNLGGFLGANTTLLTEETVWLWNGSSYDVYNTGTPFEIAPGQAFFVESANGGNVTFAAANQSHQADTFQREEPTANFELSITTNENSASTKVLYVDGKTIGFDNGYDSSVFEGVASSFNVYTDIVSGEESKLAIQTLPTDNVTAIPVGLVVSAGEEITFSAEGTNLPEGSELYLEDKETGAFTNLSETTYKVTLDSDANGSGRFAIHTAAKSLSTADVSLDAVSIYASSQNELTVSGLTSEGSVAIYSILGKQVASASVNAGSNNISLPSLTAGVYVVKVTTELGDTTKKIILE